jgi:hypothetical protein
MAELTPTATATTGEPCCAPEQQATCCEASGKDGCCTRESSTCGCSAGQSGLGARGTSCGVPPAYSSMRLTVRTRSIVRSNDITASTPVASAVAIR